jgi:hypothetical protein
VFRNGPEFILLIDIKSDAEQTYAALRDVLAGYASMLTAFRPDGTRANAVTVILSGNRPIATVAAESLRYAAIDGRLPDLESNPSRHLVPLVSDNWQRHFSWRGTGPLGAEEQAKLRTLVERAHAQGRRLRFWATPDTAEAWHELRNAGVDLLNTDDLAGLSQFLRELRTSL